MFTLFASGERQYWDNPENDVKPTDPEKDENRTTAAVEQHATTAT